MTILKNVAMQMCMCRKPNYCYSSFTSSSKFLCLAHIILDVVILIVFILAVSVLLHKCLMTTLSVLVDNIALIPMVLFDLLTYVKGK